MEKRVDLFKKPIAFEWDSGNQNKNWLKHRVTNEESEEIYFDPHKRILKQVFYQEKEERFILIGKTKKGRLLMVVFTIRGEKVRVISSRDLNRKEKFLHEETSGA